MPVAKNLLAKRAESRTMNSVRKTIRAPHKLFWHYFMICLIKCFLVVRFWDGLVYHRTASVHQGKCLYDKLIPFFFQGEFSLFNVFTGLRNARARYLAKLFFMLTSCMFAQLNVSNSIQVWKMACVMCRLYMT